MGNFTTFIGSKIFPIGVFISFAAYLIIPDSGKALTIFYIFTLIPALLIFPFTMGSLLKEKLFWPMLIFLLYMPLTILWSDNPNTEDLLLSVKISSYLILFANALKQNTLWLKQSLPYLGFITSAYALTAMFYFYGYSSTPLSERLAAWGDMENTLWAGTIFAFFAVFFALALLSGHINRSNRLTFTLSHLSLWVLIIATLLTQSKGPILSLGLSFLFISIITKSKKGFVTILTAIIVSALFLSINYEILSNILERGTSFRIDIWLASFDAILQKPFIGYGSHQSIFIIVADGSLFVSPHNRLLAVIYHGGLIAGLLLITAIAPIFLKHKINQQHAHFLVVLKGLALFFILCSMTEGRFLITRPNFIWIEFWLPVFAYLSILANNRHSPLTVKN